MNMKSLLLATLLSATAVAGAQEAMPPPAERGADRTGSADELARAREALADAARRVAELSVDEADRFMRHFEFSRVEMPRVRLGLTVGEATPDGVPVASVTDGGPAARAGLQAGDLLVEVHGASLAAAEGGEAAVRRVHRALMSASPGDAVKVRYRRGRQTRDATVTVEEAPTPEAFAFRFGDGPQRVLQMPRMPMAPMAPLEGLSFRRSFGNYELVSVSPELGAYFNTDKGLLVVSIGDDNPLTLRVGDVILSIDGREPESPTHAARILRSYAAGEQVKVEIMRQRRKQTVEVTMPERQRVAMLLE